MSGNHLGSVGLTWENAPPHVREHWGDIITRIPLPPVSFGKVAFQAFEDIEPDEWMRIVSSDPVLSAKLLAVVNSAAIGLATPAANLRQAIIHLGGSMTRIIILGYYIEGLLARWEHYPRKHFEFVRRWSACTAVIAYNLGKAATNDNPDTLATAALLSRIGSLALGLDWPGPSEEYALITDELTRIEYEQSTWMITSPVLSCQLMQQWRFPKVLELLAGNQFAALVNELPVSTESTVRTLLATSIVLGAAFLLNPAQDANDLFSQQCYEPLLANMAACDVFSPVSMVWNDPRVRRELEAMSK